jgi:pimeloyl-ACP methyl ester carboxylesterase
VFEGPASRRLDAAERAARLAEIEKLRAEGIAAHKASWREGLLRSTGPRAEAIRPLLTKMIEDWSAWQPLHIEPRLVLGPEAIERIGQSKPQVPVLWIAGANDNYQAQAAKFGAVLPQMKTVVLPDAGHLSNLEQPDKFTAALLEFLSNP